MAPGFTSARFVGRERELQRLAVALDRAASGRPTAVLVAGSSGIGISRLLGEAQKRLAALSEPFTVLRGQPVAATLGRPYAPVVAGLAPILEGSTDDALAHRPRAARPPRAREPVRGHRRRASVRLDPPPACRTVAGQPARDRGAARRPTRRLAGGRHGVARRDHGGTPCKAVARVPAGAAPARLRRRRRERGRAGRGCRGARAEHDRAAAALDERPAPRRRSAQRRPARGSRRSGGRRHPPDPAQGRHDPRISFPCRRRSSTSSTRGQPSWRSLPAGPTALWPSPRPRSAAPTSGAVEPRSASSTTGWAATGARRATPTTPWPPIDAPSS